MNKYKNKTSTRFKSKLEITAAELLKQAGLSFEYEPWEIKLLEPHKSSIVAYEKVGKEFKVNRTVRKISYKPDFVGNNWVIETKGMVTPDFSIKWKLFKKYLEDNKLNFTLFLPRSKKEIIESINIIKELKK